jgi:signal peptidase I
MTARDRAIVRWILAMPFVIAAWIFVAPTALGGSTTYSVTDGVSMQPLLRQGDLAVIRAQSSYHVGEVVLYKNQVINRDVLHRIVVIQNGHYFFKGDNNDFVDPGYATRSELVGAMSFHVANLGSVLGWLGSPLHTALLAGLASLALLSSGFFRQPVRERRRSRALVWRRAATARDAAVLAAHDDAHRHDVRRRSRSRSSAGRHDT